MTRQVENHSSLVQVTVLGLGRNVRLSQSLGNGCLRKGHSTFCHPDRVVMGLWPTEVMKNAIGQGPLSTERLPSPLSSRAQPRDLRFRGPFLEMFLTERSRAEGSAVSLLAIDSPFRICK
jgi:hypothetical protein